MKYLALCGLILAGVACTGQTFENTLYQSVDHTAENLFSTNIEGPAVDEKGNLFVVNFQRDGTIGKVAPDGSVELFVTLPEGSTANSIQFDRKGNMYLADFTGHNVLYVDTKSRSVSVYVHEQNFNQPNDLCINRRGQLFASDQNWSNGTGKLWRIDRGGKAVLLTEQMGTTNGIELSPGEDILYVNESVQRKIWAFDVDRKGNISSKRVFASFDDYGFDGMKCDREGNLYVTRYGKGVIAVLSPQGELIREIPLTGKRCSNLVFGGADGKTVFVTLQDRKGMEKFRTSVPGRRYR